MSFQEAAPGRTGRVVMVISIGVQSQAAIDRSKTELQKAKVDAEKLKFGGPIVQKEVLLFFNHEEQSV
jgi:hypothetical protein